MAGFDIDVVREAQVHCARSRSLAALRDDMLIYFCGMSIGFELR